MSNAALWKRWACLNSCYITQTYASPASIPHSTWGPYSLKQWLNAQPSNRQSQRALKLWALLHNAILTISIPKKKFLNVFDNCQEFLMLLSGNGELQLGWCYLNSLYLLKKTPKFWLFFVDGMQNIACNVGFGKELGIYNLLHISPK